MFERAVDDWIDNRELPQGDLRFAFMHPDGCNANQLIIQMGRPGCVSKLTYAIEKGRTHATKVNGRWGFAQDEILRILDLERNWIGLSKFCNRKSYGRETVMNYAREGLLGPVTEDLSGTFSILNVVAKRIDDILIRVAAKKQQYRTNWSKRKLGDNELSLPMIYKRYQSFGLDYGILKYWTRFQFLPSTKRGKLRIVQLQDFRDFSVKTASGSNSTRRKYQGIFNEICKKEEWT